MKLGTKIAIGLGVTGFGLALAGGAAANPNTGGSDMGNNGNTSDKARVWNKLRFVPQLTDTQRYFVMLTAYGEGGYNPAAHNGSASERAASANAADNNPTIVQRAVQCGIDPLKLRTGSWTMFQFLAPYVTGTAFEVFGAGACPYADPTRAPTDINLQIVLAIEHARDLQGYSGWQAYPTVGNLRLGWAAPSLMGYISDNKARLDKYRSQARSQGFPAGIVDAKLTRFPENPAAIYQALRTNGPP